MPYDHASMLLFGEGREATKPNNKYAKYFSAKVKPFLIHFSFRTKGPFFKGNSNKPGPARVGAISKAQK